MGTIKVPKPKTVKSTMTMVAASTMGWFPKVLGNCIFRGCGGFERGQHDE